MRADEIPPTNSAEQGGRQGSPEEPQPTGGWESHPGLPCLPRGGPFTHLHDPAWPHRQRREVAPAVDGNSFFEDLVQPLHLLPAEDAEAPVVAAAVGRLPRVRSDHR